MPWNNKIVSFLFIVILSFFTGCSLKQPQKESQNCCPKLFEDEDRFIMTALYFKQLGAYKDSAKLFNILYKRTKRIEYKIEEIKNYIIARDYEKAKMESLKALKEHPNNLKLIRITAVLFFHLKNLKKAKEYIQKAIKIADKPQDYEFLASIYLAQKKYELALKYYQSAYTIEPNDKIVDQMATIMFLYLDKKNEAIAYLETHSRMYGCSKKVCQKLVSFYGATNNTEGLLSVYKRLYEKFKDDIYGYKIAEIYIYKKEYDKAINFLEKSKLDEELLLDLYKMTKKYDKAAQLAKKLYAKTGDLNYLAQNAIFEFESAKTKDEKLIKDVSTKIEKVIKSVKNSLYLNYLGYLYIDFDINIDRGIELVKEALKQNPESPYYQDSLAWGYYKKGRCKEAWKLIEKVVKKLGLKDEEVKFHYLKIKDCLEKGER